MLIHRSFYEWPRRDPCELMVDPDFIHTQVSLFVILKHKQSDAFKIGTVQRQKSCTTTSAHPSIVLPNGSQITNQSMGYENFSIF